MNEPIGWPKKKEYIDEQIEQGQTVRYQVTEYRDEQDQVQKIFRYRLK